MESLQTKIDTILDGFSKTLPKFPDGRIDYSTSDKALVLTCFVKSGNKILLLRRSDKVGNYRGLWNSVAGYIDEAVPLEKKIHEELREELSIDDDLIDDIKVGKIYESTDQNIDKTWIIVPCLATLESEPTIRLDWEHTDFRWIAPEDMEEYDIVPDLTRSYNNIKNI